MTARGWLFGVMSALPLAAAAAPPPEEADMAAFLEFLGEEVDTDDEMGRALLSGDFTPVQAPAAEPPRVVEHEQPNS